MKFGPVPLDDAEGAILAHSVALTKGRLRKGITLDTEAVGKLRSAGVTEVTVARMEPCDMHEDAAAEMLAHALVPDPDSASLRLAPASTGRVNIYATTNGVIEIDADKINAVNAVHPMVTVATVPEWQRMSSRGMVATVKIIAYAAPGDAVEAARAAGRDALRLRPVTRTRAMLIQTAVGGSDDGSKGQRAMATRFDRLGVTLGPKTVVPHRIDALSDALQAARGEYDLLCILTGSATSDLHDVAPEAVRAAGGEVVHYGMPVDPGNLLFWGHLGSIPVLGLPGCARSPALNGADWVLERMLCDVPVTPADIMGMGVGGLLKEPPSRPKPRES
ncbi:molybdopterin-binding protein [Marivita hallyeonensis]|uniref:Molybdenum cofactor cytidylyltransferase n=1 Tax=Marivita hallyeonensis TaxID=996342 RepID=A0A1M5REU4_9RHOB|nr:molybdopterin-binding protein [Marivita hallyeonensis]SHH24867.1 molybdenum cofactor cytidylyltransferase [Marivita hallyeonensis]